MGAILSSCCSSSSSPQDIDVYEKQPLLQKKDSQSNIVKDTAHVQRSESEDEIDTREGFGEQPVVKAPPKRKQRDRIAKVDRLGTLSVNDPGYSSTEADGRRLRNSSRRFSDSSLGSDTHQAYRDFPVDPFIAQEIMRNDRFEEKRAQLEEDVCQMEDIISVEYVDEDQCWMVVADEPRALRRVKKHLDIVAWRLLVIPQWRSESNAISTQMRPLDGVWYYEDVLGFMSDFGMEEQQREDLQLIDDISDNYDYLADKQLLPLNSPQFLEFASKVALIRHARSVELVVIGSRHAVTDFIRQVRQLEIRHPVMEIFLTPKIKVEMRPHDDQMIIPSNYLRVTGFGESVKRQDIALFFVKYCRVLDVELFRDTKNGIIFADVNFEDAEGRAQILRESRTEQGLIMDDHQIRVEPIDEGEARIRKNHRYTQKRKRKRQVSLRRLF